jgi:NAD(P)-dependent dehydrogenase (short-subunit alcohol dehydrogenase family)
MAGVVTGAASGIGQAFAGALAERGVRLLLADVDTPSLDAYADALRCQGAEVLTMHVDVGVADEVERLADRAWHAFGSAQVVCSNAGVLDAALTWERPLSQWRRVIETNLWGAIHAVNAFVPRMLAAGEGAHLINVASIAAFLPRPAIAPYNVSKAGIVALSETLAMDLAALDAPIGVSVVIPGGVATRLSRSIRPVGAQSPRTDLRTPAEVAARMVAAIEAEQFYVFTHPERFAGVERRLHAVLASLQDGWLHPDALTPGSDVTQDSISDHVRANRSD